MESNSKMSSVGGGGAAKGSSYHEDGHISYHIP